MARQYALWQSFNGGEFSPSLDGRVDQDKYYTGCKTLENFIPTIPGPAVRRGGTRFVARVKDSTKRTWLAPFQFNKEQSYILEFGHNYIRFFVNRGQLLDGAAPFEVGTSWGEDELISKDGSFAVQTAQSADVLFMTNASGALPPRQLRRMGATDWNWILYDNAEGPFNDLDADQTIEITASGVDGSITLTATADLFVDAHDGLLLYIEANNLATEVPWEPGKAVTAGSFRRNAGSVYEAENSATTGTAPPIHLRGRGRDGQGGVVWLYRHSNYGIVRITEILSPTTATATVVRRLPDDIVSVGTKWWAFEAWSTIDGFPTSVSLFKERLFFGKTRTIYASRVGDFFNHNRKTGPEFTPDGALVLNMATESVDEIRWMLTVNNALAVGTAGSEVVVTSATENQPFSSENATAIVQTGYGSRRMDAIRIGNVVLFVQRAGQKIREYRFAIEEEHYVAPDLTILAEHILKNGVVDYCYQQEPDSIVWVVTGTGELIGLTHNRDRGVVGWHRHPIDGSVEACASIPRPDGRGDDLWLIVNRAGLGRYIEVMEPPLARGSSKDDAFYVDSGVTYTLAGAPVTVFTGLDHLNGKTVHILADGAVRPAQAVSGGQIMLPEPAFRKVHIGLPFTSRLQTMRVEAGASDGTAQGRIKRIPKVVLRLDNTLGGRVGPRFDRLSEILYRTSAMEMDESPDLFTGDIAMMIEGGWERDGHICVVQDQPLPMTVTAIIPQVHTNDA